MKFYYQELKNRFDKNIKSEIFGLYKGTVAIWSELFSF